mgnify:FL=1
MQMTEKEFYAQMLLVEPQKIRWWDRKPFQKLRSWLEDLTDILEFMVFLVLPVGLVYGALCGLTTYFILVYGFGWAP